MTRKRQESVSYHLYSSFNIASWATVPGDGHIYQTGDVQTPYLVKHSVAIQMEADTLTFEGLAVAKAAEFRTT